MRQTYARFARFLAAGMLVACLLAGSVSVVLAGTPQLSMEAMGADRIRVVVTAADAYRSVDLYTRQLDTQLWTVYANVGTTDQYGSLTTTVTVGSFNPGLARESYVVIAGQQSSVFVLNGSGGGGVLTASPTSVTLWTGQSSDVWLSGGAGAYYISTHSNPGVAQATVSGNRVTITAQTVGYTIIRACSWSGYGQQYCADISVWVQSGWQQQIQFVTTTLPQATQGQQYTANLQASGGQTPYVFSVVSGQLPTGVSLAPNGAITGTPTASGAYTLQVRVRDVYGASATQTLYLSVGAGSGWSGTGVSGQLVNEGGTVFIVYRGSKTGFTTADAFLGLGYTFGSVDQTYTGLPMSRRTVWTAAGPHPWGSWVKSGQTVYFMHESGLIPVPAYDVFLQNGGQDRWVVPMNGYDWQRPILNNMTYADGRVSGAGAQQTQRTMYGYVGQTATVQLPGQVGATRWNVLADQNTMRVIAHYAPYVQSSGLVYEQVDLQPLQRGTHTVTFSNMYTFETMVYSFIIQ